jgi:hypothetical protein
MNPRQKNKDRTVAIGKGVYVVKGAAPKSGTRLTKSRISQHFRSLNHRSRPSEG